MHSVSRENRECGIRFKFVPHQRDDRIHRYPEMDRLLYWCQIFDHEGMAPVEGGASAGNLSFRTQAGFVITPTRAQLKTGMDRHHLVEVVRSNWLDYEIHYRGINIPSSDAFLHERIYVRRPDVNAVFHGHDQVVLDQAEHLDVKLSGRELDFGTRIDAEETSVDMGNEPYLIRRGHGFIAVGATLDEAGELAVAIHRRAADLAASA